MVYHYFGMIIWILWDNNDDFWDLRGKIPWFHEMSWKVHQKQQTRKRGEHVNLKSGEVYETSGEKLGC
jgi:hypothetical protein